jgi:type II secretory pathway pseudopilin PulG
MKRRGWQAGFTLVEVLLAIVLVMIMMTVAIPYLRTSSSKTNVRGAADTIARLYATARATSIQRGKVAWEVLNHTSSTVMVIANKVNATGIDTIIQPQNLNTIYTVTFTDTNDSLVFTPRGVGANLTPTTVIITSAAQGIVDTVVIYPTGKIKR